MVNTEIITGNAHELTGRLLNKLPEQTGTGATVMVAPYYETRSSSARRARGEKLSAKVVQNR
jgi:hypothetical protein